MPTGEIVPIPDVFCRRCGDVTEQLSLGVLPVLNVRRGDRHGPDHLPIRVKCHRCHVIYTFDVPVLTVAEEPC